MGEIPGIMTQAELDALSREGDKATKRLERKIAWAEFWAKVLRFLHLKK
jgi:hypothetical protein